VVKRLILFAELPNINLTILGSSMGMRTIGGTPKGKPMDEVKKDLPAHHYPARRSSQGKRQAPREATEKAADDQGLPAATEPEESATEPPKPLSRVAQGLLLPPAG
jgi:hypothetical protein